MGEEALKYYSVGELDITNDAWVADYVAHVTRLIEERGARYLACTTRAEKLEGERVLPQLFIIVEWPSREAADAFYASDEYQPFRQRRRDGARTELALLPGEDITRPT